MAKIYQDGVTVDSETGQIYQVGRSADAVDPTPTAPTPPAPTTPNEVISGLSFETPEERAFREQQGSQYRADAESVIDENAIRTNTLAQFQAEIDALNRVYAEKKRQEQIAGQGRLGSVGAIGARRGLLGSDFGVAQERGQEAENQQVLDAIEADRLAKESSILAAARGMATQEIKSREEAKRLGAENYLKFIGESSQRRAMAAQEIAKRIYAQGIENPDFASIAKEIGVSVEDLRSTYNQYKMGADQEMALAEQEAMKAQQEEAKKTEAESLKRQESLLKEGYSYINTPAERDRLKAQGYDIVEIAGRTYGKKPKTTTKTVKVGSTTYSITQDEMGNIINRTVLSGGGRTPSSSSSPTSVPKPKFNKTKVKNIIEEGFYYETLETGSKFVSPESYNEGKQAWVDAGGDAQEYDSLFYKKLYTNPALN